MNRVSNRPLAIILFFYVLLALDNPAHGQNLNVGIFGGVSASQVDGDSYTGFNKLGLCTGVFISRHIEYNIYWQSEIKYGTRGVYKGLSDNDLTLYRSAYHIVELPISVHYLYDQRIMVELGTSPEVLVSTRFWDENGLLDPGTYPENRKFGLSVFAGLGYWFNEKLMAGLRYTNSAIPFRDPAEWNHPQYRGYFHNVISLSLGYILVH